MTCKSLSFLLLGLCIIGGLDQAIKYWVMHTIPLGTEMPLLPFLSFYHVHNSGIAFSFLSSFHYMGLITLTLIIILFLLCLWKNTKQTNLSRFGIVLVIGGAIGNLIDRIRFHYVIDYILFYIDDIFSFAIFNLADASITLGAIIILVDELCILTKLRRHSNNTSSK